MKVKGQILICTAIMLNDHSNPYIESTTVLSDIYIVRPTAPGWPRATRKRSRPDHPCKYIIRIYTCIHMYTYVYTWSKLAYCESNNASHGNDKRGYREATETPREATEGPADPRFRQQRLRKLSLRQRSRSPLSESR